MKWTHLVFMAVALLVICGGTSATLADWPTNGQPVCTAANLQSNVRVASDGNGGSIMTWIDRRTGNDYWAVYAQKMDADGNALWTTNGVIIRSDSYNYEIGQLVIASDGEGGAIIVWGDPRNYFSYGTDIYAQRVGADGTAKWAANGVRISSLNGDETSPAVVPDQTGGAIIAFNNSSHMYVERVNGSGTALWGTNGIGIILGNNTQSYNNIGLMPDGAGGAYLAWMEENEDHTETNLYMQRVNPSGTPDWSTIPICTATGNQRLPQLVSDGSGGAIVAWYDCRDGISDYCRIFAQRITPSGQVQWTSNGVAVASLYDYYIIGVNNTEMCADGLGGAIIAWKQDYSSGHGDIYAQRINGSGQLLWTSGGVAICDDSQSGNYDQRGTHIALDAPGGALIIWEDARNGSDLYGQKVDSVGDFVWASNGSPLCTASGSQGSAKIIAGGIFAWIDNRDGAADIYALKVASSSEPTVPPCTVTYQFYDNIQHQLFAPDDSSHTPFLLGCPEGDAASSDYLVVTVDFDDAYMTRDIAASEITIDKPTNLSIKFFNNGVICADSSATASYGYETTITVRAIGGGNDSCLNCTPPCTPNDISGSVNGDIVGMVNDLRVRGYDLTGTGG